MPVKIWSLENGRLTNSVQTSLGGSFRGERYRHEAEALDMEIDHALDKAVELSSLARGAASEEVFVRRWALGRALAESGLLGSERLRPMEKDKWLWLAIDRKCRHGVRADGSAEETWRGLIPSRKSDPHRVDRDVFAVGLWLQEQEVASAGIAFGGKFGNAQKFYGRKAIRPLKLREALAKWMERQPDDLRSSLYKIKWFMRVMKALTARFPDRGPGSAKRPAHYSDEELYQEVCQALGPLADEVSAELHSVG